MASYNQSGGSGQDRNMETLWQQLRGQSQTMSSDDNQHPPAHEYQPQSYNAGHFNLPPYSQGPGSQDMDYSDDIMPPAPTPPVGNIPPGVLSFMNSGGSSIGAPRAPPASSSKSEHAANLLNLLKFQQPPGPPGPRDAVPITSSGYQPRIVAPAPPAQEPSGLLAAMMKGSHLDSPSQEARAPAYNKAASPPSDTHSYLLDLLSRPKPAQNEHQQPQTQQFHESAKSSQSITLTPQSTNDSMNEYPREHRPQPLPDAFHGTSPTYSRPPADYSQSYGSGTASSSHVAPNAASYADPFADAHASSPPDKTPKSSSIPPATGSQQHSPVQMLKKPSATSSPHSAVVDMRQPSERSFVPSPEQARREEVDEMEDTQAKPQPAEPPAAENKETVAEAVSDLAEKVDREAQEALARAEQQQVEPETADVDAQLPEEQPEAEVPAAEEPPKEDEPAQDHPDEAVPRAVDASQAPIPEHWEIPEAEGETIVVIEEESDAIPVYNFPMKPWIALKLRDDAEMQKPTFRQESWFDITRLKKEFDQIDRNLVTASENHIVYGMSKAGGLRVIRQDDGKDVKLFTDTQDRIFNVSISVSPADNPPVKEAIIGTGISGTVYWTLTMDGDEDHTLDNHPEQYGFALPPINSQDGDAPGGVLKTRARPSSMHPEYFAIGRGKTINIIWPSLIMQGNLFHPGHDRTVDVDKLTKQCSLKINTGKAGKDFTFSADDSTIVTLDKSGKVKFWDIRDLTAGTMDDSHTFLPENTNLEIREPILSLNTTPDEAKPWPTSVLLVDKPRPYQRRTAQRYMIVGTKQNHAFQLWDLTLRKVVQEISLPHSKESDAVCSLMYHAATGMIIIGHPTRNSVYFLHLSAPKYNLKITQVEYMTRLATPDSYIPMPESTAVLSGFREISFSHVGELRSLDLLPTAANVDDTEDEPVLFELYGMHSKGVCYVQVRQRDLGWTSDNRVQKPVDAIAADVVSISKISSPAQPPLGGEGASGMAVVDSGATQIPIRVITRPKDAPAEDSNSNTSRRGPEAVIAPPKVNLTPEAPADKPEKPKGRKKKGPASDFDKSNNSNLPRAVNNKPADASKNVVAPQTAQISPEAMEKLEARIADRIGNSVQSGFQVLNTRIEEMADARDRAFDERQQEILRTVSQRLTENTQQLLVQTVQQEFDRRLLPTITDQTSRAVSEHLNLRMSGQVSQAVQKELAKTVPSAIAQSLQKPETVSYIAQMMSDSVLRQLHERVQHDLTTNIFPAFHNMASEAVQRSQGEYERKLNAATEHLQAKLREESGKVDQLTAQVQRLQDTLSAMASAQSKFQDKILKGQRNLASPQGSTSSQVAPYQPHTQMPAPPPVDPVVDQVNKTISAIADLMRQEQYETAIVRWLQSDRLNDVFDAYFSTISPGFLAQVAPLVQLSVCATISENIKEGRVRERIVWLETLLQSFGATIDTTMDDQVREITPKIMGIVTTRLEGLFMSVSNQAPEDPMLKVLSDLIRRCNDIARETKKPSPSNHSDHHPQHMGAHHHMMQGPPQHGEQYPGQAMQTHHYNMNMY